MKYAVQMDSGATIYIPRSINVGSAVQNFMGEYTDTQTARRSHKLILIFFSK
jgi:hypothetical protein